mmetsp:Transcript_23359/g.51839  ORF Transcript_23359/g.51839 Transcript_23359/m.51839 type:complete len:248 (-) Transcript_23359:24-767(-)
MHLLHLLGLLLRCGLHGVGALGPDVRAVFDQVDVVLRLLLVVDVEELTRPPTAEEVVGGLILAMVLAAAWHSHDQRQPLAPSKLDLREQARRDPRVTDVLSCHAHHEIQPRAPLPLELRVHEVFRRPEDGAGVVNVAPDAARHPGPQASGRRPAKHLSCAVQIHVRNAGAGPWPGTHQPGAVPLVVLAAAPLIRKAVERQPKSYVCTRAMQAMCSHDGGATAPRCGGGVGDSAEVSKPGGPPVDPPR